MPNSIALKCANCGANLEITAGMTTFACGYCGASQIVERAGGTIALKLLSDGIAKVQAGTDKTAAELAIRRLKEEYAQIEMDDKNTAILDRREKDVLFQNFRAVFIAATVLSIAISMGGFAAVIFALILWIGVTALVLIFYTRREQAIKLEHAYTRQQLSARASDILLRIEENKKIVGY